ncbi:MAG: cbb3-type cytochrome c oxidase subunit I [Roseovarius sp.]|nr:cbb3-type cytochrome c oxidase subunit I [Roseovarius sp.]
MTIGAGVSRWTMLHLGTAVVALLLALGLLASGFADVTSGLAEPNTLAVVHLITIGWLSVMMLGALYQFVPVITSTTLYSQRLPILSYAALIVGLAAMVAGFLALGGVTWLHVACLPVGGAPVVAGLALGALNVGVTLWRARPLGLPARFAALGLGFLLLTGLVGLGFALAFALPDPPDWLIELLAQGLMVHVLGGLGGWLTLTAMGVSYRLLSMFMLAPEEPHRTTHFALWLTAGALVVHAGRAGRDRHAGPARDDRRARRRRGLHWGVVLPRRHGAPLPHPGTPSSRTQQHHRGRGARPLRLRPDRHRRCRRFRAAGAVRPGARLSLRVRLAFGSRAEPALQDRAVHDLARRLRQEARQGSGSEGAGHGERTPRGTVVRALFPRRPRRHGGACPAGRAGRSGGCGGTARGRPCPQRRVVARPSPRPERRPKPIVPAALRPANAPGGPGGHPTQRG